MKLLLHICCAPCIAAPLAELRNSGAKVTGFFFNPNIHPLLEFRKRIRAVEVFQEQENLEVIYRREYGLNEFLRRIGPDTPMRCMICHSMRLQETAKAALEGGFDAFSSSLLFSRQQDHMALKIIGQATGAQLRVPFHYIDLRHLVDDSLEIARKRALYRQQYCGCIFSEFERYKDSDTRKR